MSKEHDDATYGVTAETVNEAVRKALEYNSSSGVMFLLRERMLRECIEVAAPIITKPLFARIRELERELVAVTGDQKKVVPFEEPKPPVPAKVPDAKLARLREALDNMVGLTDEP